MQFFFLFNFHIQALRFRFLDRLVALRSLRLFCIFQLRLFFLQLSDFPNLLDSLGPPSSSELLISLLDYLASLSSSRFFHPGNNQLIWLVVGCSNFLGLLGTPFTIYQRSDLQIILIALTHPDFLNLLSKRVLDHQVDLELFKTFAFTRYL